MAATNTNSALMVGGKLSYGASDFAGDFPYTGGTALGLVGDMFFMPPAGVYSWKAEEDNATRKVIFTGGDAFFGVSFESWDDDVTAALFAGSGLGPGGGRAIAFPGTTPGTEPPSLTNLVLTPFRDTHPGLVLYDAVVEIEPTTRINFSARRWQNFRVIFRGKPNASGVSAMMGKISDLS